MAATTGNKKPLEKDIQAMILKYLHTRKKTIFWRQNSGSFAAPVIRAIAGVLKRFRIPAATRNGIMAAVKKAAGHYKCTSEKGLPDITVIYRGVYMGLEVKKHDGRQSPDQKAIQKRMDKVNAHYYVVRSIDDVKKAFIEVDKMFTPANVL